VVNNEQIRFHQKSGKEGPSSEPLSQARAFICPEGMLRVGYYFGITQASDFRIRGVNLLTVRF